MPIYDVHIYALVRGKVAGIDAADPESAIRQAIRPEILEEFYRMVKAEQPYLPNQLVETEYAEEISEYLVDEIDGVEVGRSFNYLEGHHLRRLQKDGSPVFDE